MKITSGGQTGVDRAALDAALKLGIEVGGWCPEGRLAEDGPISENYPLQELIGGDYVDRTLRNVRDSEATLILYFDSLQGGTEQTLDFCQQEQKPYFLINAKENSSEHALVKCRDFLCYVFHSKS